MNTPEEFWRECVTEAADEAGVVLTHEQIIEIASIVQGARENYGMAFHQPSSPYPSEIKRLEAELRKERSKVVCPSCLGRGSITENFGSIGRSSTSGCFRCNGEGKVSP